MDKIKNLKGGTLSISHSGRDTLGDCHRKWWYSYMERRRGADKESTKTGGEVHRVAEAYLNGDTTLEEGLAGEDARYWRILEPMLPHAPTPEEVAAGLWAVETRVDMPCGPLPFKGFVDINTTGPSHWAVGGCGPANCPDHPIVDDWKTTGVPGWRYTKTPDQLAKFGQPLAYAYALHHEDPPEAVVFRHHNMYTKGKPGPSTIMPVVTEPVPWEEIATFWEEVMLPAAEVMAGIATSCSTAEEVPGNTNSCKKYGGCDHAEVCALSPLNRTKVVVTTVKETSTMSNDAAAQDKIAAMRKKLGLPPLNAQAAPAKVTPTPEVKAEPVAKEDKTEAVVAQVKSMLAAMPNGVPVAVAQVIAKSNEVELEAVMQALNLFIDGVVLKPLKAKAAMKRGIVKTGSNVAEALTQHPGMSIDEICEVSGLQQSFGLLVPKGWKGSATQAYAAYRPDTPEGQVAEVLETVDPTTSLASTTEQKEETTKSTKPSETEPSSEDSPAQSEAQAAASPTATSSPAPDATIDDDDINGAIAVAVMEALGASGKPMTKAKAAAIARTVDPDAKRIRKQRWDLIFAASQDCLRWHGDNVALNGEFEVPVAEGLDVEVITLLAPSTTQQPQSVPEEEEEEEVEAPVVEVRDTNPEARYHAVIDQVPEVFIDCRPDREDYAYFQAWAAKYNRADDGKFATLQRIEVDFNVKGPDALPERMVLRSTDPAFDEAFALISLLPVRIIRGDR